MFEIYTRFFDHLYSRNISIRAELGIGKSRRFAALLLQQPQSFGSSLGLQFEKYLKQLIRYGLKNVGIAPYFLDAFKDMLQESPKGIKVVLDPRPSVVTLSVKDIADIQNVLSAATKVAKNLEAPPHHRSVPDPGSIGVTLLRAAEHHEQAATHYREAARHHESGEHENAAHHTNIAHSHQRAAAHHTAAVVRKRPGAPARAARGAGNGATLAGLDLAAPAATVLPSEQPLREIIVTGHGPDGVQVVQFVEGQTYRLRFRVGTPVENNLALGDTAVKDIPQGGLSTHWVVTSADTEFVEALSTAKVQKIGNTWVAEFDLLIPHAGESDTRVLGILAGARAGNLLATIYISAKKDRELYREVSIILAGAPAVVTDETCRDPRQTHLTTCHEWTTPAEHIQISIKNGLADVSTKRIRLQEYAFLENFTATDTTLKGAIENIRDSLEKLREEHEDYLNNIDAADMAARLATGKWKPDSGYENDSWEPLPDGADNAHELAFAQVQSSDTWRDLASDGYALYERCFPQGTELRKLLEKLTPGSRIDFHWTDQSGAGFVSHVPWALMYMEPVDVSGKIPAGPGKFLGLRFRIAARSWRVNNGSVVMGGLDITNSMDLLYWGDKAGDDAAEESRWQASEYKKWRWSNLLPDRTLPDLKRQLVLALDHPSPAPVGVLYFYCACKIGDGAQPTLQFGNTAKREDTLGRTELSRRSLPDGPLVFANACTTAQADPHMTSELEQTFFERGVRAFIGTETKVPIRLASKFAWLYFQFFYRCVDPDPMAAGEALTQARMFLWTQYRNVGGLFYSITNQYDLYLASDKEVLALRK